MADVTDVWAVRGGRRPASLRSAAVVAALVAGGLCGSAASALAAAGPAGTAGAAGTAGTPGPAGLPAGNPAHGIDTARIHRIHSGSGNADTGRPGMVPPSNERLAAADPDPGARHRQTWQNPQDWQNWQARQNWHHAHVLGSWPTAVTNAGAGTPAPRRSSQERSIRRSHHPSGHRYGWWYPAGHRHHNTTPSGHGQGHMAGKPKSTGLGGHAPAHAAGKPHFHAVPPKNTGPSKATVRGGSRPPARPQAPSKPARPPAKAMKPVPVSLSSVNGPRAVAAVKAAYAALGIPYRWGGTSRAGYDCSGLTQHVWREAGVSIPRTSSQQAEHGKPVSLASISPGDLVIFYRGASHVGIYVGGGMVIHAPHTGAVVRLEKMKDMPIYDIRRYSS